MKQHAIKIIFFITVTGTRPSFEGVLIGSYGSQAMAMFAIQKWAYETELHIHFRNNKFFFLDIPFGLSYIVITLKIIRMSFGNKLKILRVSNKLDQETISKKLNISQPVYSRYENDEKEVNEENPVLKRVVKEFHVSAKWLLGSRDGLVAEEEHGYSTGNENYYRVPAAFLDALLKQQEMTEQLLVLLGREVGGRRKGVK